VSRTHARRVAVAGARQPAADGPALEAFQQRLGYRFQDPGLLVHALTHKSAGDGQRGFAHNERLEWLGDRVLGFLCARDFYALYPSAEEGELTRRFNATVSGTACAAVARRLGFEEVITVTKGISPDQVRANDSILGDTFEAVMAALWLDGGLEAAAILYAHARTLEADPLAGRNPKNALQEWVQKRGHPLPAYTVTAREGADHEPRFQVEVAAAGRTASAWGTSKQGAEQEAARSLIAQEGFDV
jgi:ribonuclease III